MSWRPAAPKRLAGGGCATMPRPDGRRTAAQWRARGVQSSSQPARTPCARSARQGVTLEFAQRCQKEVTCRHNKRDGRAVARASCPPARRPLLPSFLAPSGMPALRGGNLACPPIGVEQGASLLPRARNVRRVRACHSTTAAWFVSCGRSASEKFPSRKKNAVKESDLSSEH